MKRDFRFAPTSILYPASVRLQQRDVHHVLNSRFASAYGGIRVGEAKLRWRLLRRGKLTMKGFYNRILKIDLTDQSFQIEPLDDEILEKHLGGKGLASYLLYHLNPEQVDPLSPENCLIFATGPTTASAIWGCSRYGVFTKSPQTGFYAESYSGGKVPEAIDSTGFDAIVLQGRSERPVVLSIHPDGAQFHEADDIWGMDTFETEDTVIERFGRVGSGLRKPGAVVIGPAGENLVRFSVIENDYWRSAGRTGVGTVMGSKRVKALVFQGDRKRALHNEDGVKAYAKKLAAQAKDSPGVQAYKGPMRRGSISVPMPSTNVVKLNPMPASSASWPAVG
jgi:aldehyde:ferredoxin oxidoreductase